MDCYVHASCASVNEARFYLYKVADVNWVVEMNAAGICSHGVALAPRGRARSCGVINPAHDDSAMSVSAEINRGGCREEPERDLGRGAGFCIALATHFLMNLRSGSYAPLGAI
jgi:hypothetical protein